MEDSEKERRGKERCAQINIRIDALKIDAQKMKDEIRKEWL